MNTDRSPWPALLSLLIGFFMILVDSTIVSVAMPHIMVGLKAGITEAIWVNSGYLLAYAVPLLVTGRLGDRFGPKNVYLIGLALFTLSSLWCGLATSISALVIARVVQGLGASCMTPQSMAVIMRTFPKDRRGAAMGLWGGVAGLAMLIGPLLGGFLVDAAGWEWIFFINLPVGLAGFLLVVRNVPQLERLARSFDWLGVLLSAVALFLIVFGIQEGQTLHWSVGVWAMIGVGCVVLAIFVWWQRHNRREPLIPLELFRDRNFVLSNVAISMVGLMVAANSIPLMLYVQSAQAMSPSHAGMILIPMAVASGFLSPVTGRFLQSRDSRYFTAAGIFGMGSAMGLYGLLMRPELSPWWMLIPSAVLGLSATLVWGPMAMMAVRDLPPNLAGAGSGVYNTTRQIGSVIGSAAIAAVMAIRVAAELPGTGGVAAAESGQQLPGNLIAGFSAAMSQSMVLPAGISLVAVVAVIAMRPPTP